MTITKGPNPDRVFAVVAKILERRYDVTIEYTILRKEEHHEQNHH